MSVITSKKNIKRKKLDSDFDDDEEEDFTSPLVRLMSDFFTDPNSSRVAYSWAFLTCWIAIIRVFEIALESCDGPNQYTGRKNMAKYKFLFTSQQYWIMYITCMVPLILDATGRTVLLFLITFRDENYILYSLFTSDRLEMFLFCCDIFGVVPFIVTAIYLRPYNIVFGQLESVVYALVELLITGRILRMIKNIPPIRAIRLAILKSAEHLVLPVFFFFMFNITTGVFFYFVEPCYNLSICPWIDLFESTFFSIVTMATVGYGNQVPYYEAARFVACCVMIFGSLFLSMPLAILGNEYDNAWRIIQKERRNNKLRIEENDVGDNDKIIKIKVDQTKKDAALARENAVKEFEKEKLLVTSDPVITIHKTIRECISALKAQIDELINSDDSKYFVTPSLLLSYCELNAHLPVLLNGLRCELAYLTREKQRFSSKKKMSLVQEENNQKQTADAGGRRRLTLFFHDESVATTTNNNNNNKVPNNNNVEEESDDEVDKEECTLPSKPKERLSVKVPSSDVFRRTSTDIRKKVAGNFVKGTNEEGDDVQKRISMYAKILKVVNIGDVEEIRRRTSSDEFFDRMDTITKNPNSLRTRVWVLLEFPNSSKEARILQIILLALICWSVFILYTETMENLTLYGETTEICQNVVQIYCDNKRNTSSDPGCFVNDNFNFTKPLSFNCHTSDCYGINDNFGAANSNLTCSEHGLQPFEDKNELYYYFGAPDTFTSRLQMNQINPICDRIECTSNIGHYQNGQPLWLVSEFVTTIIFTIEWVLRIFVADSLKHYFSDYMNYFDMLSIFPFYVEVINTCAYESFSKLDFSILASSPQPILLVLMRSLKIFRMFKLTRHFTASKVLSETAIKIWKQILGMISFLVFLVSLFAILLYQVEAGKACYVGDSDCDVPSNAIVNIGDRILINKLGELSQFSNVFYGFWFSIVTLTTTGYGDIVPVTNAGEVMAIILMIMGIFYMTMPLTAAATAFYAVHQVYEDKRKENEIAQNTVKNAKVLSKIATDFSASKILGIRHLKVNPDNQIIYNIENTSGAQMKNDTINNIEQDINIIMIGDHLDSKLSKRMHIFLNDVFFIHASIDDLFKDLHNKSFSFEDELQINRDSGLAIIEINNHKIPVLRKIRSSSVTVNNNSDNSSSSSKEKDGITATTTIKATNSSYLLLKILKHINQLEEILNRTEENIIRIVVLHHKLRKNF